MVKEMQRQRVASPDYATAVQQVRVTGQYLQQQQAQQQASAEWQGNADAEVVNFARQLTPDHLNVFGTAFQQGGWPAVRALVAPYLSEGRRRF